MWSIYRAAHRFAAIVAFASALACAQPAFSQIVGYPYYPNYANQTYSYGLALPQVAQPNGQDEVRAADGTSCRSSMASNNAYLDVGGIGNQDPFGNMSSGTFYGRVIVPLGGVPKRIDCTSLYELEIQRLRHELELTQEGVNNGAQSSLSDPADKRLSWATSGWTTTGLAAAPVKSAANASPSPGNRNPIDGAVASHLGGPIFDDIPVVAQPSPFVSLPPHAAPPRQVPLITRLSGKTQESVAISRMFAAAMGKDSPKSKNLPNYASGLLRAAQAP